MKIKIEIKKHTTLTHPYLPEHAMNPMAFRVTPDSTLDPDNPSPLGVSSARPMLLLSASPH